LYSLDDVQFVLTARTVLYDTRLFEVDDALSIPEGKSTNFDLNKLTDREITSLIRIMDDNGFWGKEIKKSDKEKRSILKDRRKGNRELQSILVDILGSEVMKKKIEEVVRGIKETWESNIQNSY